MSGLKGPREVEEQRWKPWLLKSVVYEGRAGGVRAVEVKDVLVMTRESEGLYTKRGGLLIYVLSCVWQGCEGGVASDWSEQKYLA